MANTKLRYLRCDAMWDKALAKAHNEDVSLSERIRDFLEDYVNTDDEPLSTQDNLLRVKTHVSSIRRQRQKAWAKAARDKKASESKRMARGLLEAYVNNQLLQVNKHIRNVCKRLEEVDQ
jgi:hypothetical protein